MKKLPQLIIVLVCLFIFSPTSVLAQGREYERIRAYTLPAAGEPLIGEGITAEYFVAAGDTIEIFVWQNPDLTRNVTVRPDGKISYPLVGTIRAAGLTIDQLQEEIKQRLSEFVRFPEVTVSVVDFAGSKIIILGAVNYPGIYTYKGTMNLLEAIAMAGDFTSEGKRESVIVVSDNLTLEPKVRRVNMFRAIRKGTSNNDIVLKPNDVIYIPRRFISDFNRFLADIKPTVDRAFDAFDFRDDLRAWYHHGESN